MQIIENYVAMYAVLCNYVCVGYRLFSEQAYTVAE